MNCTLKNEEFFRQTGGWGRKGIPGGGHVGKLCVQKPDAAEWGSFRDWKEISLEGWRVR